MFWNKKFVSYQLGIAGVVSLVLLLAVAFNVEADTVQVTGGQTSVLLDTDALSNFGLDVAGYSNVVTPGDLGPDSVAFEIEPRTGFVFNPTTFLYDSSNFNPFGGKIAHSGVVLFAQQFLVGNFEVAFDANRVTASNSGFFVVSTADVFIPVFDIGTPSLLDAQPDSLTIQADLLIAPEFADFWFNSPLVGLDVGDVLISANSTAIPGPVVVVGQSLGVSPGLQNAGGLTELETSDNMDLQIFRDPLSINAVTQFQLTATSPTATPTTFEFTLEGNCISRPNVVQRIQLFNFVTNAYETVDERNANRAPNPDLVVTATPGGDLSRFVDPSTLEIRAQVRYRADIARAGFASNTDQAVWTIE